MVVDAKIADLIGVLEYRIGSQTYNPNSYNGWTGEEGCGFKYPVSYCKNKADLKVHTLTKTKSCIKHIDPECIGTMKYAFGSNHLYIGDGLLEVLKYLEKIYDIDFNQLEEKRIKNMKSSLAKIEERLNDGEIIRVSSGIKRVGLDIPAGNYKLVNLKEGYSRYLSAYIYDVNGDLVDNIFTVEDEYDIVLEEGYFIEFVGAYSLKK